MPQILEGCLNETTAFRCRLQPLADSRGKAASDGLGALADSRPEAQQHAGDALIAKLMACHAHGFSDLSH